MSSDILLPKIVNGFVKSVAKQYNPGAINVCGKPVSDITIALHPRVVSEEQHPGVETHAMSGPNKELPNWGASGRIALSS
jgi:hypothetical protein